MIALVIASLFYATPRPLEMPKAEAYLARSNGVYRLVDKYDRMDLWTARTVIGRWEDYDMREFTLSKLEIKAPSTLDVVTETRVDYEKTLNALDRRDEDGLKYAIDLLSPVELAEKGKRSEKSIRGFEDVRYYEGTNTDVIVAAFLPEKSRSWYLATWAFITEDDIKVMRSDFEKEFLAKDFAVLIKKLKAESHVENELKRLTERELYRRDAKHAIEAYDAWHAAEADGMMILDELEDRDFAKRLELELPKARREYAAIWPSEVDQKDNLAVMRVFADRKKYLAAVGEDKAWTAAYWAPDRRELVAYLPERGEAELIKTIRHEAFHQYLSYATAMVSASPWLNEGYAQYFEHKQEGDFRLQYDVELASEWIEPVMMMNYDEFYSGTNEERAFKYHLAWSIAHFIEKGVPEVRNHPFANLKRDYMKYLMDTRDMRLSTEKAFGNRDNFERFVSEYKNFFQKS